MVKFSASTLGDIEEVDDNHPIMKLIMENEYELVIFKKKDPELFERQNQTLIKLVKSVK
ncbi:hypothetical protein U0534_11020 [Bacillus atrophaeus]|uniref:Uncharacterized protein n=1 Tax=Bacillus atrophaeus (strain 1942) TaxID=720555 RepID=A0ABN3ZK75_BACA1|nr:hypothetical protein [Bacillus atrophaeus]ADP34446.1 hypothetical protein BATR1942_17645 [Bacillus atrophaeus 1942]EIM11511.1 hypothetical protein UY9_07165 [Bacillus atrophaeus C89]MEC1729638.1 hypothetical protein [Bacillus atrophaeus]WQP42773.1 hypothetical protein U0534_11020 [Bacillus atrophaeus]